MCITKKGEGFMSNPPPSLVRSLVTQAILFIQKNYHNRNYYFDRRLVRPLGLALLPLLPLPLACTKTLPIGSPIDNMAGIAHPALINARLVTDTSLSFFLLFSILILFLLVYVPLLILRANICVKITILL
jgi:hypothetical protein